MTTALDYLKDNCSWEELRPLGQCVMIVEETGNIELAELAATHLLHFVELVKHLNTKVPEYEQYKKECDDAINKINIGIEKIKKMAEKMGIEFNEDDWI